MPGTSYETGLSRLQQLVDETPDVEHLRNEAATRLQLIDRLLFDCLGWSRDEAELEEYESGQYADYVLDRRLRLIVVEAKREGVDFLLPPDLQRISQLKALYGVGGALAEALDQAMNYAQDRGVPYAAICNGHQLVAFLATRTDGVSPRAGRALVFNSLQDLLADFSILWDAVGSNGCATRRLTRLLGAAIAAPSPPRLSEGISDYPGTAKADQQQITLTTLSSLFLPEFVRNDDDEREFLAECYAPPGAIHSSVF